MALIFHQSSEIIDYAFTAITEEFLSQIRSDLILELRAVKNLQQKIFIDLKKYSIEKIKAVKAAGNILSIFGERIYRLNLNTFLVEEEEFKDEILREEERKLDKYVICNFIQLRQLVIYGTDCGHILIEDKGHIVGIFPVRKTGVYVIMHNDIIYAYGKKDHRIAKLNINISEYLHKKLKLNNDNKNNARNTKIIEKQRTILPAPVVNILTTEKDIYLVHKEGSVSIVDGDLNYQLHTNHTDRHFNKQGEFKIEEEKIKIQSNSLQTEILFAAEKLDYDQPLISYFNGVVYFIDGYSLDTRKLAPGKKINDLLEKSVFLECKLVKSVSVDNRRVDMKNNRLTLYENDRVIQVNNFSKEYLFKSIYAEKDDVVVEYDLYRTYIDRYGMVTEYKYKFK